MKVFYDNQVENGISFQIQDLTQYAEDVYAQYGKPRPGDVLLTTGREMGSFTPAEVSGSLSSGPSGRFHGVSVKGLGVGGAAGAGETAGARPNGLRR